MNNLQKGLSFEQECIEWFRLQGFTNLVQTRMSADYGADIVGEYKGNKYAIECKNHIKKQGVKAIQAVVYSKSYYKANRGIVISNSGFTKNAQTLALLNQVLLLTKKDIQKHNFEQLRNNFWNSELDYIKPQNYTEIFALYEKVKKEIGRVPTNKELPPTLRYYIRKSGGLLKFLKSIGDSPSYAKPTPEILKKEYFRIKKQINKTPTLEDIKKYSTLKSTNAFHEYPFTKLQLECGDRPNIKRGVTKSELIKEYYKISNKLGHLAKPKEINELGIYKTSYYIKRFGSFNNFINEIGENVSAVKQKWCFSNEESIEILKLTYKLLNKLGYCKDLKYSSFDNLYYKDKQIINIEYLSKKFNGWINLKQIIETENNIS